jgi:hypothetical protein
VPALIILSGKKCLEVGKLLDEADWPTMAMEDRKTFIKKHRLDHFGISETQVDLPGRYIRASRMQVLWDNVDKLPPGIARIRELSRFREHLRDAFARNLIKPTSKREDLDRLYEHYSGKPIAPRHP